MFEIVRKTAARFIYRAVSYHVRAQYDAARSGRRLGRWTPPQSGPNASIIGDLETLRARSRDLVRNNPWISRGVRSFQSNEIGCEIVFKSAAPDEAFRNAADSLWERQCQYFDADGQHFSKLLSQIVSTRRAAGEVFIRRRPRNLSDGLPVPIQYQLLEPDFCPVGYMDVSGVGRRIYAGIEFNGIGKRTAYWMYRAHPGDGVFFADARALDLMPVPASQILHHYDPFRPGQIRGVPAIVQAMIKAKDFDEYDDAELLRKKGKAAYTGVLRRQQFSEDDYNYDPFTGETLDHDTNGVGIQNIEGGSMIQLLPGEDVTMFEGDTTGQGYVDFVRQQLLGVGAGQDVPYEFVSGDFSKLNDRTLRVVLDEYHRTVEQDRWQLTVPQVCYPIWKDFIQTAIAAGALQAPDAYQTDPDSFYKVECHPEGWPYLHELQDAQADEVRLKNGITSRKRIAAERGEDIREIDQENAEDKQRAEQLGLSYSFDVKTAPSAAPTNPNNPDVQAIKRALTKGVYIRDREISERYASAD